MKKLLLTSIAGVALIAAGSANAADLRAPVYKAPPPVVAPAPQFSWTGCFVGAHWGWGWGRKDIDERNVETFEGVTFFDLAASDRIDTSGPIFGGQVGCDYQFGWGKTAGGPGGFVIGIQFDGAATDINGFVSDPFLAALEGPDTAAFFGRVAVKEDWLASLTGRLGFTPGFLTQTLFYVRGGVAWTHDKWDLHGAQVLFLLTDNHFLSPVDQTRTGWTVGAGVEWAFLPNWSAFVEWNHYDFGHKNLITASFVDDGFSSVSTFDTKQLVETVKIGVNYRFNLFGVGKGKAPVVARY